MFKNTIALLPLVCFLFYSCRTTSFYIVRHAEKEVVAPNMSTDVPLSAEGRERAEALKERLKGKVQLITSTQTTRTRTTAQPLADAIKETVYVYTHTDTALMQRYRKGSESILLVGHSNTVDDLVNFFMGKKILSDLPDTAYGDLFIVKKRGSKFSFRKERFGK